MGQNFALNMASHGFTVSVCNRSPAKVDATVNRAAAEGDLPLKGYKEPKEFIESLSKPRKVILLVQAGAAVDATIAVLSEFMEVTILQCNCYTIDTRVVLIVVNSQYGTTTVLLIGGAHVPFGHFSPQAHACFWYTEQ